METEEKPTMIEMETNEEKPTKLEWVGALVIATYVTVILPIFLAMIFK